MAKRLQIAYLYALAGRRCQQCNQKYAWLAPLRLRWLSRIIGSPFLASYEMNRQHIWPENAWGAPPLSGRKGVIAARTAPAIAAMLGDRAHPEYWPILERCTDRCPNAWAEHLHNLILVCPSHNENFDKATARVSGMFARKPAPPPELAFGMEGQLLARIRRLRELRGSAEWTSRLCGLSNITADEWATLSTLFQSTKGRALASLASPDSLDQLTGTKGQQFSSTLPPAIHRDARRFALDCARQSGRADKIFLGTAQIMVALESVVESQCSPGYASFGKSSPPEQRTVLKLLVWLRHLLRADRLAFVESVLGPNLYRPIDEASRQGNWDYYSTFEQVIDLIAMETSASFFVENSIDLFLLWARKLCRVSPVGWRRSSIDDVLHLATLAGSLSRCALFFDHLALGFGWKTAYKTVERAKSTQVAEILVSRTHVASRLLRFMVFAESILARTSLQLSVMNHLTARSAAEWSLRKLIWRAAQINVAAASAVDEVFRRGPAASVRSRWRSITLRPAPIRSVHGT